MREASLPLLLTMLVSGCVGTTCGNVGDVELTEDYTVAAADYQAALDGGDTLTTEACEALCRAAHWDDTYLLEVQSCADQGPDAAGDQLIQCTIVEQGFCEGRAHESVARQTLAAGPDQAAVWLARAAHAEAASVGAFHALAAELDRHGAPHLAPRARAAAVDEIVHARLIGQIAASAGGRRQPVHLSAVPDRDLETLATENAIEGCVGETWAALQARWQAEHAPTAELRTLFAQIARDEARHAQLAADLHDWATQRLPAAAAARVEQARHQAWTRLQASLVDEPPPGLGLPDAATARRLAGSLRTAIA